MAESAAEEHKPRRRVRIESVNRSSHVGLAAGDPNLDHRMMRAEVTHAMAIDSKSAGFGRFGSPQPTLRPRTISGSKSEDHLLTTPRGQKVYTKGRPLWFNRQGQPMKRPYLIGICGGSASGKTTVARRIIERLEIQWVTVLSMDSFYKVLNPEQKERAGRSDYNFDHPDAFDFDLLEATLRRLQCGKSVDVPVYDFNTHSRDKNCKLMYGADVILFEGILSFYRPQIADMMDIKIFVDTDSDTRLARRLIRDTAERGRDLESVLEQYFKFVKPAFENFIAPAAKVADIIVPRGGGNEVAVDLIVRQIKNQLSDRGYDASGPNWNDSMPHDLPSGTPESLCIIEQTPQLAGLHTMMRNRDTPRDEFIFASERVMQILIENAMSFVPYEPIVVDTPDGQTFEGCRKSSNICGVAIMRAGETLERPLRAVVKDCKIGKLLIQMNERTKEPELYYSRLPANMEGYKVLLLDAIVATGAAAIMAIRVLLDHDVPEENITLLSLLMAETGVHSIAYAFPKVKLVTTAVDKTLNEYSHIIPGMGNFGDRYYGTEGTSDSDAEGVEMEEEVYSSKAVDGADPFDDDDEDSVDSAIAGSSNSGASAPAAVSNRNHDPFVGIL